MKLHFEADLDYQLQAIDAVCDLFHGQELCRNEFTVAMQATPPDQAASDASVGNRLKLRDDELLHNLAGIQLRGGLTPSSALASCDFTVEMETGTGKTYVYLRSIFELNKRYGFSKFVIVVPSVAIKEGVYKTLQITEAHFKALYAGVPFEYFLYDSNKPGAVSSFATSPNIQIMVVTVGAINKKDVNNLYKESEKTAGERPIDLIKATRPVVIVDEPQSVDGGLSGAGKTALDAMNPLCTLRYSATHADKHHMVFRLDAVDAYERKLVKQVEVASASVVDAHNTPFLRLLAVNGRGGAVSARVELDVAGARGPKRQQLTVADGDDLEQLTMRAIYRGIRIGEINTAAGAECLELRYPGGEVFLKPGQAHGDIDAHAMQRQMIRRTIAEHLDKEKRLRPMGIKVLSLFFIDEVDKYRRYDADSKPVKGDYARVFEDEYRRAAQLPAYRDLFGDIDVVRAAVEAHDGYFSIDRTGGWTDTAETNAASRESAERAYQLIMRDKEKLLLLDTPLKFIFSHSALKEGWDNPNVFQICTLRDIRTERGRRQTIGRGLRLCVNQQGERVRGFEVNTLTVIANESYEQFAENLQQEIEEESGVRFGVAQPYQRKLSARLKIQNADERKQSAPLGSADGKAICLSDEFNTLLDRARHTATDRVQFDNEQLVRDCTAALRAAAPLAQARLQWRKAGIAIGKAGIEAVEAHAAAAVLLDEADIELPDVLTELQDRTGLTRRTIVRVLTGSGRLDDFKRNPQQFIEVAEETINRCKRLASLIPNRA